MKVGLLVYRSRLKKSFFQLRDFTIDAKGNILVGKVSRKAEQKSADGMELEGDFREKLSLKNEMGHER